MSLGVSTFLIMQYRDLLLVLKFFFFFIDKKQLYIDKKRTQEYTGCEQKGPKHRQQRKQETTRKLPTPHPSKKVYNRVCVNTTVQISPSPQVGNKINFNSLGGGDLVLKYQQIPCSPEIPEQTQQGCKPNFSALFTHSSSLPS